MNNVLEINNLSFGYNKNNLLYDNFSLTLKQSEIKVIVGSSGAGKSTLFELILGNLKPLSGTIKSLNYSQVFQDPYSSFHPSYSLINQIQDVTSIEDIDKYLLTDVTIT